MKLDHLLLLCMMQKVHLWVGESISCCFCMCVYGHTLCQQSVSLWETYHKPFFHMYTLFLTHTRMLLLLMSFKTIVLPCGGLGTGSECS